MSFLYAADIRCVSFILTEYWASKIQEYQPWLQQEMQFGTDESKRVKPSKAKAKANSNNEGSFRKLDIDWFNLLGSYLLIRINVYRKTCFLILWLNAIYSTQIIQSSPILGANVVVTPLILRGDPCSTVGRNKGLRRRRKIHSRRPDKFGGLQGLHKIQ